MKFDKSALDVLGKLLIKTYLAKLRMEVKSAEVEERYLVTLTIEEVRSAPWLAGLAEAPSDPETITAQHELCGLVQGILNHKILTERERRALRLRFGIGCREHTPAEAARKMGVSVSNVSGAVRSAVRKLRKHGKCTCLQAFHK